MHTLCGLRCSAPPRSLPLNSTTTVRFVRYREAELKHGRLAMVALAGWPLATLFLALLTKVGRVVGCTTSQPAPWVHDKKGANMLVCHEIVYLCQPGAGHCSNHPISPHVVRSILSHRIVSYHIILCRIMCILRRPLTPFGRRFLVLQVVPPATVCTGNGCAIDTQLSGSALPLEGAPGSLLPTLRCAADVNINIDAASRFAVVRRGSEAGDELHRVFRLFGWLSRSITFFDAKNIRFVVRQCVHRFLPWT